jgi:hypothetical protein
MIAGPDGAGKSTLINELLTGILAGKTTLRLHYRPRFLPGRLPETSALTNPHGQKPYPAWLSWLKTVYVFSDYLLGWVLSVRPVVRAGGWVIVERGWWDNLIDPRRYRLAASTHLVRLLGGLVPQPDLLLVLEAPAATLRARKPELPEHELIRQMQAWRTQTPPWLRHQYLDASEPLVQVVGQAEAALRGLLQEPTLAHDWVDLPRRSSPRWTVPRTPNAAASNALLLYQPVTLRGLAGWTAGRVLGSVGGFRFLPSGRSPTNEWSILAPHIPPDSLIGVMRSTQLGRSVVIVLSPSGVPRAIAKVATDARNWPQLEAEAEALCTLGPLLPPPLLAPRLMGHGDGFLLLEPAVWRPRLRPWRLPPEVARALGQFFRAHTAVGEVPTVGLVHGDFAPWNLLRTSDGWLLLDWECAQAEGLPFYDVFHYLIQSHALLGQPSPRALRAGLCGHGWIGASIHAFAEGAGLPADAAASFVASYLEHSRARLSQESYGYTRGIRARERLVGTLGLTGTRGGKRHP